METSSTHVSMSANCRRGESNRVECQCVSGGERWNVREKEMGCIIRECTVGKASGVRQKKARSSKRRAEGKKKNAEGRRIDGEQRSKLDKPKRTLT